MSDIELPTQVELKAHVKAQCDNLLRALLFGNDVISILLRNVNHADYHRIVIETAQETLDGYKKAFKVEGDTDT